MEHLLAAMKILGDDTVQRTQLKHRMDLAKAFGIQDGMSVIEVGCGQGDTTVALADRVGESGRVLAVDIAPPDYGAPITLREATSTISASPLGSRVEFQLETDLLDLPDTRFDVAVLSHCTWYFRDPDQLLLIFKKLRRMANRICIAEWDVNYTQLSQRSHFTAAAILALYSEFVENDGNIQHLFDSQQLQKLLEEAGWSVAETATVVASYLQDGAWETDYAQSVQPEFSTASPRIRTLAGSFYSLLEKEKIASLDSVVLLAE